jgi:glycosyltransferase involved in cell wall biosynthesis
VTTDAGAIGEIAIRDATALVVAKQNAVALAAGIDRLLGDAALAARLAWSARERAQLKFGIDAMLREMKLFFGARLMPTVIAEDRSWRGAW